MNDDKEDLFSMFRNTHGEQIMDIIYNENVHDRRRGLLKYSTDLIQFVLDQSVVKK